MSWNVGDDEWLAEPTAVPGAGPVDGFDRQLIESLRTGSAPYTQHPPGDDFKPPVELGRSDNQDPDGGVPPPPYSAAFDANAEAPSYETSSFVAEAPEPEAPEPEEKLAFHIPTLSSSAASEPDPAVDASRAAEGFVIPALSRASEASEPLAPAGDAFEEVELDELEELEAESDVPVRTGETVITRAPEFGGEPAAAADIARSVYDYDEDEDEDEGNEDDDAVSVIPDLVERVDSAELELVSEYEVTAVEPAPSDPDADTVVEPAPTEERDAVESSPAVLAEFVIPMLARIEPDPVADGASYDHAAPEPGEPSETADPRGDIDGVVIPSLFARVPSADVPAPAPVSALEEEEVEAEEVEAEEVEPDAIESLDTADLEELKLAAAAAAATAPEIKPVPPAPPEARVQTQPQAKRRKAWYDDVFAEHFLFLYPLTWEHTCERDAVFMHSLLGAREGMSVLDVGCGDGRHAVELAKLGARVTGIDNSLALLLAAAQTKEAAELEDGRVEFIHGDMRRLPRDREFDAVACVGTTLGYFEEEQNWLCLQEMHDRLLPGGRLLIHVFNRDFIAPHLPARSWWQGKRCMVIDEAEMNFFANRLRVHRTIIFDDGRQYEHHMFMRAYTVQDLGKAISQLGMRVIEVSGSRDTRGRFYGSASPDIWIVAEKKA